MEEKAKRGGKRCVVQDCSAKANAQLGISLHLFPIDPRIKRKWNNYVAITRKDWVENTDFSVICSQHFTQECFESNPVAESLGYKPR